MTRPGMMPIHFGAALRLAVCLAGFAATVPAAGAAAPEVTYGPLRCASGDGRPDVRVMVVMKVAAAREETWIVQAMADGDGHPALPWLPVVPAALAGCSRSDFPTFVDGPTFMAAELEYQRRAGGGPAVGTSVPVADAYWFAVD